MIYVYPRERHVVVVTRLGDVATGADQNTHHGQPHVRLARCPEGERNILGCAPRFC